MARYVDGFLIAVPKRKIEQYRILYKSRAHRDRVNAKVMKDPRLAKMMEPGAMPFDMKRMTYGGFTVIVDMQGVERIDSCH